MIVTVSSFSVMVKSGRVDLLKTLDRISQEDRIVAVWVDSDIHAAHTLWITKTAMRVAMQHQRTMVALPTIPSSLTQASTTRACVLFISLVQEMLLQVVMLTVGNGWRHVVG